MGFVERAEREKAERRRQREELILKEAEQLFLKKGFPGTTIGDIARACELTNGAIYLYYKNKDELILRVMTGISRSFGDLLKEEADRTPAEGQTSGFSRLERLFGVYRKTFREYRSHHLLDAQFNMLFYESYPESPQLDDYFAANKRVLSIMTEVVTGGIEDGSVKPSLPSAGAEDSAQRTARLLLNAANSYIEKISLRKGLMEAEQGIRMEEELEDYLNLLLASLRA